jgi:hypothetical protein
MLKQFGKIVKSHDLRCNHRSLSFILLLGLCLLLSPIFITNPLSAAVEDGNPPAAKLIKDKPDSSPDPNAGLINLAIITCTEATIIPTAGAIDFYKGDIPWIIHKEIQAAYPKEKFLLIPPEAIALSLKKFGYDPNALELPDKEDIIKISAVLNADAILVMELSNLGVMISRTSYQYHAIIRYRAYQVRNNHFIIRQFLNEGPDFSNKATPKEQKNKLIETIRATVDIVLSNCLFGEGWE